LVGEVAVGRTEVVGEEEEIGEITFGEFLFGDVGVVVGMTPVRLVEGERTFELLDSTEGDLEFCF
jgi:hypothetical protein